MSASNAVPLPPKLSRRKKFLFTLILFAIAGLLFELVLRILQPELYALSMAEQRSHAYRDWCRRDLVANAQVHYVKSRSDGTQALDYELATDGFGLRRSDPETPLERNWQGVPRRVIHCLGDSMTMGWGVKPEESYPEQLQGLMGNPWLVLNLGVDGIGVRDATERSRRLAAEFPPEVAILFPFKNDIGEDAADVRHDRRSGFRHALGSFTDTLVRSLWIAQTPVVAKMAFHGGESLDVPLEVMIDYIGPDMTAETWQTLSRGAPRPAGPSVEALQSFADECTAAGRPFLVIFAHGNMYAYTMARYCREKGIPYLPVPVGYSRHLKTDLHLNPEGCRVLAQAVHLALMTGEGVTGPWTPLR
jgi:hypothetical protein